MVNQKKHELVDAKYLLDLRLFSYDILRRVFLAEPTKELVAQLKNNTIYHFPFQEEDEQLKEGVKKVVNYLNNYEEKSDFEALHWDYTRMFIGPYELPAPIWESSYVNKDGLLFQAETLKIKHMYLRNNFVCKQQSYEAEDHLGLELDYMYQLTYLLKELLEDSQIAKAKKILQDQDYFLTNHLLNWTPYFSANVLKHADTDFYKGIVKILNGFLQIDKACVEELLNNLNE